MWGIGPTPYNSGAQKSPFSTTAQFNGKFNGLYFGTKRDMLNWASAVEIRRVSYIVSKQREVWFTNSLELDRSFYQPYINSAH